MRSSATSGRACTRVRLAQPLSGSGQPGRRSARGSAPARAQGSPTVAAGAGFAEAVAVLRAGSNSTLIRGEIMPSEAKFIAA